MKQIFIINGEAMTGKSILANLLHNPDALIVEDCSRVEDIIKTTKIRKIIRDDYNYMVVITNNLTQEMLDYLKTFNCNISICEMRRE